MLIALFGVGAVAGPRRVATPPGRATSSPARVSASLWIGVVVAVFSLAPALVGRALRRGRVRRRRRRSALAAGMGAIQSSLDGRQRVLAFTAFHVVLRVGLAIAAIGAGIAGDLLADVHWPVVGTLRTGPRGTARARASWCSPAREPRAGHEVEDRMTVAIVTDSAAAVPPTLVGRVRHHGGADVARLRRRSRRARASAPLGELLGDARITTSAPTPGEFEDAIRAALDRGASDVVGAHDRVGDERVARRRPRSRCATSATHVRVVDTTTAAGAQALVVLAAARAANAGLSLDEVDASQPTSWREVRLVGDGARPRASGAERPGSRDRGLGRAHARASARCSSSAPARCTGCVPRCGSTPPTTGWSRASGGIARPGLSPARGRAPRPRPRGRGRRCSTESSDADPVESFISEFGSVMVVHAGPGLVGLAWWWEPVSPDA